jgi:hypothetical protein
MGATRVQCRSRHAYAAFLPAALAAALLCGCGGQLVVGDVNQDAATPPPDAAPAEDSQAPPDDAGVPDAQAADRPPMQWAVDYQNRLAGVLSVHGVAENDVWAVGTSWPAPRHWDGAAWTDAPGGPTGATVVFAVAADDVWTNGAGGPWRWDGAAWTPHSLGSVTSIWGLAADDVWVAAGQVYRWDGASWSAMPMWGVAVSGVASDDVWVVGSTHASHWDGATVTSMAFPNGSQLRAVLALATSDVWVAGDGIAHWDGVSWTHVADSWGITSLAGRTRDNVWAATAGHLVPGMYYPIGAVWRFDGAAWTWQHTSKGSRAVWAPPSGDVWAFSDEGLWLRQDATDWSVAACGTGPATGCAVSDDDVWLAMDNCSLHRDAAGWSSGRLLSGTVKSTWCRPPDQAWTAAVAPGGCDLSPLWSGALRWSGAMWAEAPGPWSPSSYDVVEGVWGTAGDDVWVVTNPLPLDHVPGTAHWDGTTWTLFPVDGWSRLAGGWSAARDDAWLVGAPASAPSSVAVLHWDGVAWGASPTLLPLLGYPTDGTARPSIWGSSSTDVWVVGKAGAGGAAAHWDGAGWQANGPGSGGNGFDAPALGVTGTAADDVWVLEAGDRVWHWDGKTWRESVAPASLLPQGLTSISAAERGSVWGFGTDIVVRISL